MRSLSRIVRTGKEDSYQEVFYPDLLSSLEKEKKKEEKVQEVQEKPPEIDLMQRAVEQVEAILSKAREEAAKIKEEAYEEGYIKGMEQGCTAGEKKAYEEHQEKLKKTWEEARNQVENCALEVQHVKEKILEEYLDTLKNIALAVGEKIIQTSLKSSGEVVKNMILSATGKLKKCAWAKIYIAEAPEEEKKIQGDAELLEELSRISENVKVIVMEEAAPGTCIIELPQEIMDISVGTQIENIKEILNNARV
ncbi:hypothetical protein H8S37_10445 [Mediterraneibacter sp. NSJ-55]|uniref:Flagellar assembly protein FliH/Type III secretion system HrpE domain-containing protein n=1 Tax=Mediterraneibacter hominis TaxID=2763054 RepID=A0A923LIE7_9FIRM|nr:hypothetical protein [Mediterraneibacter hominis]MBC5689335.1 hypothetical protein [Mediterraneibacter hominis]